MSFFFLSVLFHGGGREGEEALSHFYAENAQFFFFFASGAKKFVTTAIVHIITVSTFCTSAQRSTFKIWKKNKQYNAVSSNTVPWLHIWRHEPNWVTIYFCALNQPNVIGTSNDLTKVMKKMFTLTEDKKWNQKKWEKWHNNRKFSENKKYSSSFAFKLI